MEDAALKKVQERLEELPKDVQAAIMANDFEERISKIGQSNRLHIDQIGELGDETMLVMLGFAPMEGFQTRLQKTLHLYDEQASAITTAIENDIFLPIRESMKKFQTAREVPPQKPTPPEQTPVVPLTPTLPTVTLEKPGQPPMESADMMLSQKVVSVPPKLPTAYKTDPYREPAE